MQTFNNLSFYHINNVTSTSRDLLINHNTNVIVWSDVGRDPAISQTNLNGKQEKVIYTKRPAFHLTIDDQNQLYFFIDITTHSLYSVSYNGHNEKFYLSSFNLFSEMISMFVWNNNLFVANSTKITKVEKFDYEFYQEQNLFDTNYFNITEFDQIIFEKVQFTVTNSCYQANCSGLCLPIGHSYRCQCLRGTELGDCDNLVEQNNHAPYVPIDLATQATYSDQLNSNNYSNNHILTLISIALSSVIIIMVIFISVW